MGRLAAVAALALLALAALAGCGGGEGVAEGATVKVYVSAGLCPGAQRTLDRAGGEAGEVKVEARCLRPAVHGRRLDLAVVGANARRATEDSTAVAVIGEPGRPAKFTEPILQEAGLAYVPTNAGAPAMHRVLQAMANAGATRTKVHDALE